MLRDLPESEFGPMLPHGAYRESSFLRNKRLPRSVNESRVTIAICIPGKMDPDVTCAGQSPNTVRKIPSHIYHALAPSFKFDTMYCAWMTHSSTFVLHAYVPFALITPYGPT